MLATRLAALTLVALLACNVGCSEPTTAPAVETGDAPAAAAEGAVETAALPELRYYVIGPQ